MPDDGALIAAAEGKPLARPLDVFIVASADPKVIVGEYARITGHAELPPLWSFGYLRSHRTLAGPDEVMWVGAGYPDAGELRNARVEPIVRTYLELRYRLLPYTYTLARECCDSGLLMIRSLWLHNPDDPVTL